MHVQIRRRWKVIDRRDADRVARRDAQGRARWGTVEGQHRSLTVPDPNRGRGNVQLRFQHTLAASDHLGFGQVLAAHVPGIADGRPPKPRATSRRRACPGQPHGQQLTPRRGGSPVVTVQGAPHVAVLLGAQLTAGVTLLEDLPPRPERAALPGGSPVTPAVGELPERAFVRTPPSRTSNRCDRRVLHRRGSSSSAHRGHTACPLGCRSRRTGHDVNVALRAGTKDVSPSTTASHRQRADGDRAGRRAEG